VAGVSAGSKLIKSTKVQKFSSEYQSLVEGLNIFTATYDGFVDDADVLLGAASASS